MKYFGKGFNYNQDGPGNRLVYHLFGCNLKCPWCSNPEGIYGQYFTSTPEEVVAEIFSAEPMFFDGGGVTFTGGEATLQLDELIKINSVIRAKGIHSTVETNGMFDDVEKLCNSFDLIIFDFKTFSSEKFKQINGNLDIVSRNLDYLFKQGAKLLIRTTLVDGFNTDDVEKFVQFYRDKNTQNSEFEFLRYHEYGKDKWAQCGKQYKMTEGFVDNKTLNDFTQAYKQIGLKIVST